MPGRDYTSDNYRYGFNGMEKDDKIKGNGNSLDFGARIYDSRLGRWLSVDVERNKGPQYSSYIYSFNNPILFVDPDGNYAILGHYRMTFKALNSAGFDKTTSREIAYYASTYADHAKPGVRFVNHFAAPFLGVNPFNLYFKDNDRKENTDSQDDDKATTAAIHAMTAYNEWISKEEAVDRALYGGIVKVYADKEIYEIIDGAWEVIDEFKGVKPEDLTTADKKRIGLAFHTIQDAEAHKGGRWNNGKDEHVNGLKAEHSILNDMFGDRTKANSESAKAARILKGEEAEAKTKE